MTEEDGSLEKVDDEDGACHAALEVGWSFAPKSGGDLHCLSNRA